MPRLALTLAPLPSLLLATALLAPATGCERGMSYAEFREALDEVVLQGEGQAMANDIVEISTSFTIGQGLAEIRDELRAFAESQIPCSTVTLDGDDGLSIDFGELGDACSYNGHTYAGVVSIRLELAGDDVIVHHGYAALRNELVQLDGEVDVTWGGGARRVVSDLSFVGETSQGETRELEVQGDRTMTLIDPQLGLAGGVEIEGWRDWQGARGDWHLDIEAVEVRGQDPVPQSGQYVLSNPEDKLVTLSFERLDADTITVTLTSARRERVFEVSSTGEVDES